MEIVDFHTHTFDKSIAERAITKLGHAANIINYLDGTDDSLIKDSQIDKIDLSVVLPIATKINQGEHINAKNVLKNENIEETRLLYFAAIHPEDENISSKLRAIKAAGFKGIKLHPAYQNNYIDDLPFLHLISTAQEQDLITVIHAGEDIGMPGNDMSCVKHILNMLDSLHPKKLVLAHMGGWNEWDEVEHYLAGADVYLDTSFCLNKPETLIKNEPVIGSMPIKIEQFQRIINKHGINRILFGTDSPWTDRGNQIKSLEEAGLDNHSLELIFSQNAKQLLQINITNN